MGWAETSCAVSHFRDRDGSEVDVVLESDDGRVAGIEVKASVGHRPEDFRGLSLLRDRLGDRFVFGALLHCGSSPIAIRDRLAAVPVNALWAQ